MTTMEYLRKIIPCSQLENRWELPGNFPVLIMVMVIYHYVEIILRILITLDFCITYTIMKNIIQVNQLIYTYNN